jgi:hypothetical protein
MNTRGRVLLLRLVQALLFTMLLGLGAVPAQATKPGEPVWDGTIAGRKIVLMAPDIEVSLLTAGGVLEVRQDWTEAARTSVFAALSAAQAQQGAQLVVDGDALGVSADASNVQKIGLTPEARADLLHLHEVAGQSALLHRVKKPFALPNKSKNFDWTLGSDTVKPLKEATERSNGG